MRKVIGIGETILDVIFRDNQPHVAVPGGSTFNSMVSLSRVGIPAVFISELGNDRVGETIRDFMEANGLTTDHIGRIFGGKSPVSLAFLNESNDADYVFYTDYPAQRLDVSFPTINEDDILLFGSYYSLNPVLRERVTDLLELARLRGAIIYYDPNFRRAHAHEAIRVRSTVMDNYEYASLVRGSSEDFFNLYGLTGADRVYADEVAFYCKRLIVTNGADGVNLFTEKIRARFDVPPVAPLSTVGAGDNFNAGIIYGLVRFGVRRRDLPALDEQAWEKIIRCAMEFASEVCTGYDNYVSLPFADARRIREA
jgi:fructokinase